jgi:hypothetical protein
MFKNSFFRLLPFRARLLQKFAKSANTRKNKLIWHTFNMGIKDVDLMGTQQLKKAKNIFYK